MRWFIVAFSIPVILIGLDLWLTAARKRRLQRDIDKILQELRDKGQW